MNFFFLTLLFTDGHIEEHLVKRFTNLSENKAFCYYYEKPFDEHGKGTMIKRSDIDCFELSLKSYKQK